MGFESSDYIIGYGSLLNHDSRLRHSGLNVEAIYVRLNGWQRVWQAPSPAEQQTYLGVVPCTSSQLNAALLPMKLMSDKLKSREQDYNIIKISIKQLEFCHSNAGSREQIAKLASKQIWLCQPKHLQWPTEQLPVYQSYVDTCLAGAIELGQMNALFDFIASTQGWSHFWLNDRTAPRYPRKADTHKSLHSKIDGAFAECQLLHHRRTL